MDKKIKKTPLSTQKTKSELIQLKDKDYFELIELCAHHQTSYDTEVRRRNGHASSDNENKYKELIDQYLDFVHPFEDEIPFMYIDSQALPTVGCGHLLGFGWSNFWKKGTQSNLQANKILQQVPGRSDKKDLTGSYS